MATAAEGNRTQIQPTLSKQYRLTAACIDLCEQLLMDLYITAVLGLYDTSKLSHEAAVRTRNGNDS